MAVNLNMIKKMAEKLIPKDFSYDNIVKGLSDEGKSIFSKVAQDFNSSESKRPIIEELYDALYGSDEIKSKSILNLSELKKLNSIDTVRLLDVSGRYNHDIKPIVNQRIEDLKKTYESKFKNKNINDIISDNVTSSKQRYEDAIIKAKDEYNTHVSTGRKNLTPKEYTKKSKQLLANIESAEKQEINASDVRQRLENDQKLTYDNKGGLTKARRDERAMRRKVRHMSDDEFDSLIKDWEKSKLDVTRKLGLLDPKKDPKKPEAFERAENLINNSRAAKRKRRKEIEDVRKWVYGEASVEDIDKLYDAWSESGRPEGFKNFKLSDARENALKREQEKVQARLREEQKRQEVLERSRNRITSSFTDEQLVRLQDAWEKNGVPNGFEGINIESLRPEARKRDIDRINKWITDDASSADLYRLRAFKRNPHDNEALSTFRSNVKGPDGISIERYIDVIDADDKSFGKLIKKAERREKDTRGKLKTVYENKQKEQRAYNRDLEQAEKSEKINEEYAKKYGASTSSSEGSTMPPNGSNTSVNGSEGGSSGSGTDSSSGGTAENGELAGQTDNLTLSQLISKYPLRAVGISGATAFALSKILDDE